MRKREYITKQNVQLAVDLAKKAYFQKILPSLQAGIKKGDIEHVKREIDRIYDELSIARRALIKPVWISVKEKLRRWNEEVYVQNSKYRENLIHETDRGEFVRSKSEKEIANELNRRSEMLDYKYERPLSLIVNGRAELFYPDFTVINKMTGKIRYWEHAGKMDDSKYAIHFVDKINIYMENGIFPGEDLIITYEASTIPLNSRYIKKCAERIENMVLGADSREIGWAGLQE